MNVNRQTIIDVSSVIVEDVSSFLSILSHSVYKGLLERYHVSGGDLCGELHIPARRQTLKRKAKRRVKDQARI